MMPRIHRQSIDALGRLGFLLGLAAAAAASGKERPMSDANAVESVIARLIGSPPVTQAAVEHTLGIALRMTQDNGDWQQFEASGSAASPVARVDYRVPVGAEAKGERPLLLVEFSEQCPSLDAVRTRFGPLRVGAPPSPHAKNGTGYLDRDFAWGRVSFGYRSLTPHCLSSVVFHLAEPHGI